MNMDELIALKERIDYEVVEIKNKLDAARLRGLSDTDWFYRATAALRFKQRASQQIQTRLARLRQERATSVEAKFVSIAREHLAPDVFTKIMDLAQAQ